MLLLETEQVKHSISELNLKVPTMPSVGLGLTGSAASTHYTKNCGGLYSC